jgi:hypothetical protein
MVPVTQALPSVHIANPREYVRDRLLQAGLREKVRDGNRIAITAGSRGIGGFVDLISGIADAVRIAGGEPFLIPAMGSHGGATAEGQQEILRRLGVTSDRIGAEIRATMDTVSYGVSPNGAVAHLDVHAANADGIIVLGRTKTHPESAGELASGLLKMCTVGLGKQAGAQEAHSHGLWDSVRQVPKLQMAKSKILLGIAIVENGYRQPAVIEVVPATYEAFLEADVRLLRTAKTHLAKIPFDELDLLVVDELGKNISGAGMDPNVIGHREKNSTPSPDYKRLAVLSLTYPSLGNALGIGMADFTTDRCVRDIDRDVTYINLLTATEPGGNTREGAIPVAYPCDRGALEAALFSSLAGTNPRVCRIRNTASLGRFWVSEALMTEVRANEKLTIESPPEPFSFDAEGNLSKDADL